MKSYKIIKDDPLLFIERPFDMTVQQQREKGLIQFKRYIEIMEDCDEGNCIIFSLCCFSPPYFIAFLCLYIELARDLLFTLATYDPSFGFLTGVHFGLFHDCIKAQGTDEQINNWCPKVQYNHLIREKHKRE
jgi:hypothetical protein